MCRDSFVQSLLSQGVFTPPVKIPQIKIHDRALRRNAQGFPVIIEASQVPNIL
jgi:hypothetical protein